MDSINKNTVLFELIEDKLTVCNNGKPFSIEGVESLMATDYSSKIDREHKENFNSLLINDQVNELLRIQYNMYKDYPRLIQKEFNSEKRTQGDYSGREILELLQNCIDAMEGNENFDIGEKGLGFRSILNWCDRIEIYSDELSIAFGEEEKENQRKLWGFNQNIATLAAPAVIPPLNEMLYTTKIILTLNKSFVEKAIKQFAEINEMTMVFLPKIEELIINTINAETENEENKYLITFKKIEQNGKVTVTKIENDVISEYCWLVFKQKQKTYKYTEKNKPAEHNYGISVAFCDNSIIKGRNFYTYFKTNIPCPIGWLCHAVFKLSSDRNSIIPHEINIQILKEMVSLIEDSSEKITSYASSPENVIKSLIPIDAFLEQISWFKSEEENEKGENIQKNFKDYYYANIGRKKIIPTVNGEFISIKDSPWLAEKELPALFKEESFKKFLNISQDSLIRNFIKEIARQEGINLKYSIHDLKKIIDNASDKWPYEDCLTVFEWWRNEFTGRSYNVLNSLPNLIKLENGEWAKGTDEIDLKSGNVPSAPEWVKFRFVSKEFQKTMKTFYKNDKNYLNYKSMHTEPSDERNISGYAVIKDDRNKETKIFHYQDKTSVISKVNTSVGDNWDYACEYVLWLYKHYKDEPNWRPPQTENITYKFPSQNKKIKEPKNLYFGKYYENDLAEICAIQDSQEELFNFPKTDVPEEEKEKFVIFIKKFGVQEIPVQKTDILYKHQISKDDYINEMFVKYPIPINDCPLINDISEFQKGYGYDIESIIVVTYPNLDKILAISNTTNLLSWIKKDSFLRNSLKSKNESLADKPLTVKYGKKTREIPKEYIRCYIAHMFSVSKWIQIEEKRYSPNQIIFDEKIGTKLAPHLIGKRKDEIFSGFSAEDYDITAITNNLGFNSDFSKIKSSNLYAILNELSKDNADTNGEISKKIYMQIMETSGLKDPDETCQEREKYLKNGKVYCRDGHFYNVKEVQYADKSFPKRILEKNKLINLSKNRGAVKAKKWFGVEELKPDIVMHDYQKLNIDFKKDFRELLKGLYVYHNEIPGDKSSWSRVKNMQIILASSGRWIAGELEGICENYDYAKNEEKNYVLIVGSYSSSHSRYDEKLTNVLLEILKLVMDIDNFKLDSTFRDLWKIPRDMLRDALIQRHENPNIWQEADYFFDGIEIPVTEDYSIKNKILFNKCKEKYKDKFTKILYAKLLKEDINKQKTYLAEIAKYEQIMPNSELLKDENCDVLSILQSIEPAVLLSEPDIDIDINAIGNKIDQDLRDAFPENEKELIGFLKKETYDSLLRFGHFEYLKTEFENHLKEKEKPGKETPADSAPKVPVVTELSSGGISRVNIGQHKSGGNPGTRGGYTDHELKQAQNAKTGKLSEETVLRHLKEKYGKDNVKWVSQFAREAANIEDKNLDGLDGLGYDIEYTDNKTNEKYFIEVKTNRSNLPNILFDLTVTERSFAENNEQWRVYIVSNPKADNPDINILKWQDISDYAREPSGYRVEFAKK